MINETDLEQEIEKKILEMEAEDYEFPKRFSGKDYLLLTAVIIICMAGIILGAFLH